MSASYGARSDDLARDYERARSALEFIPPDDRDLWVRMAMAVKDGFGDTGFDLWDAWSRQSDRYDERDARDVWRSVKAGGGVTLATLFHEAKTRGWRDNGTYQKPTPEEITERRRIAAERMAKEAIERSHRYAEAATKALAVWNAATPITVWRHPYMTSKKVSPVEALREIHANEARDILGYTPVSDGETLTGQLLVVPVYIGGELSTVEFIDESGRKAALYGGAKRGGFWSTGPLPVRDEPSLDIVVGEGVATVLTGCQAVPGSFGVATLSSGNLDAVATEMRQRFPTARLVVLADMVKDTGLFNDHAIEAARAVGGLLVVPDFGESRDPAWTDLNDVLVHRGADAVRAAIERAEVPDDDPSPGGEEDAEGGPVSDEASSLAAVEIYVLAGDPPTQRARPQGDILIDIGLHVSKDLFCGADDDNPYAVIRDCFEVWDIASKRFRKWLRGCYFKRVGKGANANSVRDAVETIASKAQFSKDRRKVFLRTAEANGKFYVDLTDDEWRVVEIDADDWRVLDKSPVMFTRRGSPAPFPMPERGGSISELWPFLNVPVKLRVLVPGWLLSAMLPFGPYPILLLQGEANAAKTFIAWVLRSLCDPSTVPLRAPTRDEKDFLVSAIGNWCVWNLVEIT